MTLFTAAQLENWLHYAAGTISADELTATETVVTGWLLDAAELEDLPSPLNSRWQAWALELGGIAFENPTSMTNDTTLDQQTSWYARRREEILERVKKWSQTQDGASGSPRPRGCFPAAQPWPEPLPRNR